ncbi:LSM1 homolog, mRNA degradation associated [Columba livia]|uniref:LSM1 homolog, mRNA degradation associated n=1 Tax=Columba livia TaxID=8932 RepID=A0A2I0LJF7_COLLI|nr:LSM1 homolog, mRNA degradation associated [Columba livia]
MGTSLEASLL